MINLPEKALILAKDFINQQLMLDPWFKVLHENGEYSLVFLTGSSVQGDSDEFSDLDLFLVCPHHIQLEYKLGPVYEYNFKGHKVEVSLVTTEKLISDKIPKIQHYWWNNAIPILSTNPRFPMDLEIAGHYTSEEKKNKLWTLYVMYNINLSNLERLIKRNEEISFAIVFNESIGIFCEIMLKHINIFKHAKWFGDSMQKNYPEIYTTLKRMILLTDQKQRLEALRKWNISIKSVLSEYEFDQDEIENWDKHNVHRINFQRY